MVAILVVSGWAWEGGCGRAGQEHFPQCMILKPCSCMFKVCTLGALGFERECSGPGVFGLCVASDTCRGLRGPRVKQSFHVLLMCMFVCRLPLSGEPFGFGGT